MTDTQLGELFDRWGERVPDRMPSPASLSALGARARRRRTTRRLLAASAAVVVATAGTTVARQNLDREPLPSVGSVPQPRPGFRFVGRGNVVVQVPVGWHDQGARCGGAPARSYYFSVIDGCFGSVAAGPGVGLLAPGDGIPLTGQPCPPAPYTCQMTIAPPGGHGVVVELTGSGEEVERLVATVQVLPEGYVAVPYARGLNDTEAHTVMAGAGLSSTAAPFAGTVASSSPAAGTVVPVGMAVTFETALTDPSQLEGRWRLVRLRGEDVDDSYLTLRFGPGPVIEVPDCDGSPRAVDYEVSAAGGFRADAYQPPALCLPKVDVAALLAETSRIHRDLASGELRLLDVRGEQLAAFVPAG